MTWLLEIPAIGLAAVGMIFWIYSDVKFWKTVRRKDPALWESLGRPVGLRYWFGQSLSRRKRVLYRWERKFRDLGEPLLDVYYKRSQVASGVAAVGIVLFCLILYLSPPRVT